MRGWIAFGACCWIAATAFVLEAAERDLRFDFGGEATPEGYRAVWPGDFYDPERGFGWVNEPELMRRDRLGPDPLRRDFIFGREPAVFRVDLDPGIWNLALHTGDMNFDDHVLELAVDASGLEFPVVHPRLAEFAEIRAAFEVDKPYLLIRFDSPVDNWVANALVLERTDRPREVTVSKERMEWELRDTWADDIGDWPDPSGELLKTFRERAEGREPPGASGLNAENYLELIAGNVDFFRGHQDERGAIIDPYREVEYQYATPCYALAAAVLIEHAGRDDLVESALSAMDWAVHSLSTRQAATAHEDFYAPVLAHAYPILKKRASSERAEKWRDRLASFDPWAVYRSRPGGGNWNIVAASGEALFHELGIRDDTSYIEHSFAAQGRVFRSPWGLYVEGPMPYDHFPRLWAADMVAAGYEDAFTGPLAAMLDRAAVTSLFIQSPTGELPSGGRSAHHQWNEAQQAVTFEIYAAKAAGAGDRFLAGVYKRAARLALESMRRWQRPSGELWIVKNRVDPGEGHAYEGYSSHSQYNLLAMAMLAIAHGHALETEDVSERITPAEFGGFVVNLRPEFPHVFANAGGTYIQINTAADSHFNVTGLMRIHSAGHNPQIGPSDGPVENPSFRLPDGPRKTVAVGPAWPDGDGEWDALARYGSDHVRNVEVDSGAVAPDKVGLTISYEGDFGEAGRIVERYTVKPESVELSGEVPGIDGPLRYTWPVLADDGQRQPEIGIGEDSITVALEGDRQRFRAAGAARVGVGEEMYPYHNGWAREGFADFEGGETPRLSIVPERAQ